MTQTKINISVSISRNYNTVKAEFVEETIEYDGTNHGFQTVVEQKYMMLTDAVERQLSAIGCPRKV